MSKRILCSLLLGLAACGVVVAHELQANRLTLVLRERNHLSLTFFIDYTGALYRALAPGRTFQEFVLTYAAMKPEEFQREVLRAQAGFQGATRLTLPTGNDAIVSKWSWPDARRVQATLQERAMQSIVAPDDHTYDELFEIRAEAVSSDELGAVEIRLPQEFQKVLVVSYRPRQAWADPNAPPTQVRF